MQVICHIQTGLISLQGETFHRRPAGAKLCCAQDKAKLNQIANMLIVGYLSLFYSRARTSLVVHQLTVSCHFPFCQ